MKQRHIKTFPEKYGIKWDLVDCVVQTNYKGLSETEIFKKLPYLGYAYCPIKRDYDLWDDTNKESGLIKLKVIGVSPTHCFVASIDDHNHRVAFMNVTHGKYVICGNVVELVTGMNYDRL